MKHRQKMIIDGYNVIYASDSLRKIACRNLEDAREELVGLIKGYIENKELQVTLVFDGKGEFMDALPAVPGKMQVVFSRAHESADQLIVSTLRESSNPRLFIVVTSDMEHIGKNAKELGADVLGSKAFLQRMGAGGKPRGRDPEKPEPKPEDVSFWLDKFLGEESGPGEEG